jgi:hypothetical protein
MAFQQQLLTPVITHSTDVPAPAYQIIDGAVVPKPSAKAKVIVDVCSEFMMHSATVDMVSSKSNVELVVDGEGFPVIFALTGDMQVRPI